MELVLIFFSIAHDPHGDSNKIEQLVSSPLHSDNFRDVLSQVEKSAIGADILPYRLFHKCA
jgi:hypothetical protein